VIRAMPQDLPPQNRPWMLSPEQERIVRESWAAGLRRDEVCRLAGVSRDRLMARLRDQLSDLPRRGRGNGGNHRGVDPSPAEIALATAAIRRSWPVERWLGLAPESATCRQKNFGADD